MNTAFLIVIGLIFCALIGGAWFLERKHRRQLQKVNSRLSGQIKHREKLLLTALESSKNASQEILRQCESIDRLAIHSPVAFRSQTQKIRFCVSAIEDAVFISIEHQLLLTEVRSNADADAGEVVH